MERRFRTDASSSVLKNFFVL